MDVKLALNNVSRGHLIGRMMQLVVENDLIRWTESFMSERKGRLVLNGQEGTGHGVNTGIPQGSPLSPILFTIYLPGLFGHVEENVPGIKALAFVDDVTWLAEGENKDALSATLERAAKAAQEWADANAVTFDTQKTEAIVLSRRRRTPLANARGIRVGETRCASTTRRPGGWASGWTRS